MICRLSERLIRRIDPTLRGDTAVRTYLLPATFADLGGKAERGRSAKHAVLGLNFIMDALMIRTRTLGRASFRERKIPVNYPGRRRARREREREKRASIDRLEKMELGQVRALRRRASQHHNKGANRDVSI